VRGPATLSSAFVVAALGVLSVSAQLNPTVKLLPKPQAAVPPECEQGLAPPQPRVMIAEAPAQETKPARAAEPPSLDLKTRLRTVQMAAEQNDREAFKAALADVRSAIASYPRGGERDAANEVVSVNSDLERLWDYSFSSPTGAFFDSSTDFVSMMRRYPDYAKFISDSTLNVGGQVIYPTRETIKFLTAEAARRLARLGVRTPTRITEAPVPAPRVLPAPVPSPQPVKPKPTVRQATQPSVKTPRAHVPRKTTKAATTKPRSTHRKSPTKIAEAKPAPPQPHHVQPAPAPAPVRRPALVPAPVPAPVPQPIAPTPRPLPTPKPTHRESPTRIAEAKTAPPQPRHMQPVPAPLSIPPPAPVPAPSPQPVAPTPMPTPTPKTTSATPTLTETTNTTPATATTGSEPTTTTTTAPQNQQQKGGGVNLLVAIILIIVGIGVLVILFRASD
jgi:hypothetical protein